MSNGRTSERGHADLVDTDTVTSLDATLPPTPGGSLAAAHGANVLVFSHDAELCNVVKTAARNRYPTRVIDKWWDVLSQVEARQGRIVLVDVDALGISLERALKELKSRADWLVVLIAAKQAEAQDLMRFWSERRIHRLLIKPAAVGITRLLLESAVSRYLELQDAYDDVDDDSLTVPSHPRPRFGLWHRLRKPMAAVAGALVVAGAAYSAMWWFNTFRAADENLALVTIAPGVPDDGLSAAFDETAEAPEILTESAPEPAPAEAANVESSPRALPDEEPAAVADRSAPTPQQAPPLAREPEPGSPVPRQAESAPSPSTTPVSAASSEPVLPVLAPELPAAPSELESMLAIAALRFERGALIEPPGDGAVDYLGRARAIDSRHPDVLAFEANLGAALTGEARTALDARDLERTAALVEAATGLGLSEGDLAAVRSELSAVLAEREAAAAERRRQEAEQLADSIGERIVQGRLIGAGDSALEGLGALAELNPEHPRLAELNQALDSAIAARIESAIASEDWAIAQEHLTILGEIRSDQDAVTELTNALEVAQRRWSYLANSVPIGRLELVEAEAPVYPREALRGDVTGWVEIEFIVDIEGKTRAVAVVDSEPVGLFEDSAVAAVRRYVFAPFVEDGRVYERRGRVRIRFELD